MEENKKMSIASSLRLKKHFRRERGRLEAGVECCVDISSKKKVGVRVMRLINKQNEELRKLLRLKEGQRGTKLMNE